MTVPQARHRLSGGADLVSGDEGVRLHADALVGELDLAVDRLGAVVAGEGLTSHRAAEPLSPPGEGGEGVPVPGEAEADLLAAVGKPDRSRRGQVAVSSVLKQVSGGPGQVGQGLGPGDVVGDVDGGHGVVLLFWSRGRGMVPVVAGTGQAACTVALPDWMGSTASTRNARRILPSRPTHGANTRPRTCTKPSKVSLGSSPATSTQMVSLVSRPLSIASRRNVQISSPSRLVACRSLSLKSGRSLGIPATRN